jgi:RNA polymerase sigma factor (sigma-70 family)
MQCTVPLPAKMPATTTSATTTELLRAAAAGDQAAWCSLLRRYDAAVTATIRAHGLQPADALDAAQRTWMTLVERHDEIRQPEALGGWLRTTARNECLRIIRARQRDALLDVVCVELADAGVDVEQSVVDADTVRRLRGHVDRLPPRAAVLVTALFDDDPAPYCEIARRTGIPIGSIGPTRARALVMLRRLFDGELMAS